MGAETMSILKGINVLSIPVADLDRARALYRDVLELGQPLYELPDAGWIEFQTGGGGNLARNGCRCWLAAGWRHDRVSQRRRLPCRR
jgi:catechol 2,3-dioxygenase-like lactoylglutathione lyase family enzyme